MQPNQPPAQPGQPPLAPPDPNQSYEPAPPAFGQPQVFMPQPPTSTPQQFGQPYPPQQQAAPQPQPGELNPFDLPVDRSQRPPSAFEQRFHEYVVAAANPAQTKKPRKKWPLVLLIIFLVLAMGGAGAYYWYSQQISPEKRFALAIENHLEVSKIGQDYELKTAQSSTDVTATVHSVMDISDIKTPKVTGDYTLNGYDASARQVKFALANKSTGYLSFVKYDATSGKTPALNSWYQYDPSSQLAGIAFEPLQVANMIPKATGEMIVGSFTADQRQQITAQIAAQNPYTIVSSKDEGDQVHYVIGFDATRLNALNKLVAGMDGEDTTQNFVSASMPAQADLWVDKATNHFSKVSMAKDKDSTSVTLTYPTTSTVTMPKPDHTQADLFKAVTGVSVTDAMFTN